MKLVGIILLAIGLVDFIGAYADFDLWTDIVGVQLPEMLWSYSAYIEMALGYFAFSFGSGSDEVEEEQSA